jgi:hypothetical protein
MGVISGETAHFSDTCLWLHAGAHGPGFLGRRSGVTTGETAIDSDTCGDASGVTAGETARFCDTCL